MTAEESTKNEESLGFLYTLAKDVYIADIVQCSSAKLAWDKRIVAFYTIVEGSFLERDRQNCFHISYPCLLYITSWIVMDINSEIEDIVMLSGLHNEYETLILNLERDKAKLETQIVNRIYFYKKEDSSTEKKVPVPLLTNLKHL